jgi:hypothetical protein
MHKRLPIHNTSNCYLKVVLVAAQKMCLSSTLVTAQKVCLSRTLVTTQKVFPSSTLGYCIKVVTPKCFKHLVANAPNAKKINIISLVPK